EHLDVTLLGRDQLDGRARVLERLARLGVLDLLDALVGGEDRDALALEVVGHRSTSFVCCTAPGIRPAPLTRSAFVRPAFTASLFPSRLPHRARLKHLPAALVLQQTRSGPRGVGPEVALDEVQREVEPR